MEHRCVVIVYQVGAGDDPVRYRGLAHLTEHMMFAGSPRAPEGYFAALEPIGGRSLNASTSLDQTKYCAEVPAASLSRALYVEADRMGFLLASINEEQLEIQRRVVLHEYHERGGGGPGSNIALARVEALYPEGHPYRRIYEDPDDIRAIRLDHVRWFFQRYYTPANATLAVAGHFDTAELRESIERYFGQLRGSEAPATTSRRVPPLQESENIDVDEPLSRESISYAWHPPAGVEEGDAALD
ncbi:MAG: insulinase family protein, partial [Myxococcota bacterium]